MHVIIGKGNLGVDLKLALTAAGERAVIVTQSMGFEWPESMPHIRSLSPTHVWVTAGFGSVKECEADFSAACRTHIDLPLELSFELPYDVKLGVFSTDYVADPENPADPVLYNKRPGSKYAYSKRWIEDALELSGRPNTAIFRVGSLYGSHYPEKTFPGKLIKNFPEPCELSLPENIVVPSPTWWVAERLVTHMNQAFSDEKVTRHHVAPLGGVTTRQWGHMILGPGYRIKSSGIDHQRPVVSGLGCSLGMEPVDTCTFLWQKHLAR